MKKPLLAIFSNFFINNEERLQRMKDSFYSFKDIDPNEWVINIRGKLKYKAGDFLQKEIGSKLNLHYLQNSKGWFYDSSIIANKIKSNYVMFWIEDNILISSPDMLTNCIFEMEKFKVDQLWYSFFTEDVKNRFSIIKPHKVGNYITITQLNSETCKEIRKKLKTDFYYVSVISIMRVNFFMKVLLSNKPYIKRWPRYLPFDFEKKSLDKIEPIILHALPNQELFVNIDDDRDEKKYSLISRGLYPNRVSREDMKVREYEFMSTNKIKILLKKVKIFSKLNMYVKRLLYTVNLFFNK
mgnify:CR=1 FL=1|jgi:hypothetical protein